MLSWHCIGSGEGQGILEVQEGVSLNGIENIGGADMVALQNSNSFLSFYFLALSFLNVFYAWTCVFSYFGYFFVWKESPADCSLFMLCCYSQILPNNCTVTRIQMSHQDDAETP